MTKNKHEHHKCDHMLKFCEPCNEVYCTECEITFTSEPCTQNHYPSYSTGTWTYPNFETLTTYDDVVGDGGNATISNDVHADHITLT